MPILKIPSDYYRPSALNCAGALTGFTALISGIYHGVGDAHGAELTQSLENILMFGPSALGAVVGYSQASNVIQDPRITEQLPEIPEEVKGCTTGCQKIIGGITGTLFPGLLNLVGYGIGNYVGNQFK